jgi:3-deoxy-D-manno-octulosonic acid kinase
VRGRGRLGTRPSAGNARVADAHVTVVGQDALLCWPALAADARPEWFAPAYWRASGAVALETSGRGSVWIVSEDGRRWVLRHYHRGGFISRFVFDHYLWLGLERSRAFREWRLLRRLSDAGLPVPNPVAARVRRAGPVYTADILTVYIPDTRKLSAFIAERRAPEDCWRRVGRLVRAVHDQGVDHPDLTAHNLLLDARGEVFLVDFDNAHVRRPGVWQQRGLERLERSLRKVALETGTDFDERAWAELVGGYGRG